MKIVPNKIFTILAVFLSCVATYAAPVEPPPPSSPPPPPGLPLDGWIVIMMFISLIYGLSKIIQLSSKKASK
jgi:hypothetical protein